MNFFMNRTQSVRFGKHRSSTTTTNTGVPQGCVLSPSLFHTWLHRLLSCKPYHQICRWCNSAWPRLKQQKLCMLQDITTVTTSCCLHPTHSIIRGQPPPQGFLSVQPPALTKKGLSRHTRMKNRFFPPSCSQAAKQSSPVLFSSLS